MVRILNHINKKLREHKIELDILAVEAEYLQVQEKWQKVVAGIKVPIKFLIIGEATVSWANYFYNEQSKTTSFLNPWHFDKKTNKTELIAYFQSQGILVFDLYPLPLPTFIYDNIKLDCSDDLYNQALCEYFKLVIELLNHETKIVIRYSKLKDRCEFILFSQFIDQLYIGPKFITSIAGKNRGANEEKITEIF
jgi:hypothetical protein